MARRGSGLNTSGIFLLLMFAVAGLYLFSQFSTQGAEGLEFALPDNLDATTLGLFKLLIVGVAIFGAYVLLAKLSGNSLSKRDAFTIILIGIALWFIWDNFLVNILEAQSLDNIAFSVGQKMGAFP